MAEVFTPNAPAERVEADNTIAFNNAVNNRDERSLLTIAANTTGTPMSEAATSTAIKIGEGKQQFAQLIDPLEKRVG